MMPSPAQYIPPYDWKTTLQQGLNIACKAIKGHQFGNEAHPSKIPKNISQLYTTRIKRGPRSKLIHNVPKRKEKEWVQLHPLTQTNPGCIISGKKVRRCILQLRLNLKHKTTTIRETSGPSTSRSPHPRPCNSFASSCVLSYAAARVRRYCTEQAIWWHYAPRERRTEQV